MSVLAMRDVQELNGVLEVDFISANCLALWPASMVLAFGTPCAFEHDSGSDSLESDVIVSLTLRWESQSGGGGRAWQVRVKSR